MNEVLVGLLLLSLAVSFYLFFRNSMLKMDLMAHETGKVVQERMDYLLESDQEPAVSIYDERVSKMLPLSLYNALFEADLTDLSELKNADPIRIAHVLTHLEFDNLVLALRDEPKEIREIFNGAMSERAYRLLEDEIATFDKEIIGEEETERRRIEYEKGIQRKAEEIERKNA